jgi:hypothetical protein
LCLSIWFGLWRQQPEIIKKKKVTRTRNWQ